MGTEAPAVVVFSTLFPNAAQPQAGLFIRERMFRVGRHLPLTVVAPVPWFPFQSLLRRWRPHFRPTAVQREVDDGVEILRPRFLSFPGVLKRFDGVFLALGAFRCVARLKANGRLDVLDAHFAYPDGYAATILARWLEVPCTVTLRGTEARLVLKGVFRRLIAKALRRASRVFAVSSSLAEVAATCGLPRESIRVIGNGVDLDRFAPLDRLDARDQLGIPRSARVLVTVGALVERKGFHRVIESMLRLTKDFEDLHYLVVGGASPEGDDGPQLRDLAQRLGLSERVHFMGAMAPKDLSIPLSAADVFVLATRNEGWANVLLEAMACGLPIVTTDVGGNREVVCRPELGIVVPFGVPAALDAGITAALMRQWDGQQIRAYAIENSWDERVRVLLEEFVAVYRTLGRSREEQSANN